MEQKLEHVRLLNAVTTWRSTASAVIPILIYERRELRVKKINLVPRAFPFLGSEVVKKSVCDVRKQFTGRLCAR